MPARWLPLARRSFTMMAARLPRRWQSRMGGFIDRLRGHTAIIDRDYAAWVALHRQMDEHAEAAIRANITKFDHPPLISVVMPVFNPPTAHLHAAIKSVQDQIYPWWELCIADDASTDPEIARVLREVQDEDARIKVVWRTQNGHISAASNSALQVATGDFIALLDHDDLLSPRALYEVAARIVEQPDVDIIYSDEDHVDEAGLRSHPYFKPGWNPELMLGQNLISHLGVFRRKLVERIGGFRIGFEGSQDFDLALRVVAQTQADRVVHIPMILYHWRQGAPGRTFSEESHNRCVSNGRRAVHEFATRDQADTKVMPAPFVSTWTRVIYPVPTPEPLVSVIVAAGKNPPALRRCIDGLLHGTSYPTLEILVASGGPEEPEVLTMGKGLIADARVRSLRLEDAGNDVLIQNRAVRQARGSVVLLLSPNLVVSDPGWLREMLSHAIRPHIGAVGAKLLDVDGWIQHAGFTVGTFGIAGNQFARKYRTSIGYFGHLQLTRNVTAVSSDCMMVRRDCFVEVGGLNDKSLQAAFSDVDLCLKLVERGYRNLWTPHAELSYDGAKSLGLRTEGDLSVRRAQAADYMRQRWAGKLLRDSYWNPNLTLGLSELALTFPPRGDENLAAAAA